MRKLWIKALCLLLAPPLALCCYALWWGVAYRLPRSREITVDARTPMQRRFCPAGKMQFCAGLANNPHGFPGHAYVVWNGDKSRASKTSIADETLGFCPGDFWSIVPSVYEPVMGVVDDRAATGNDRNLERITVLVDAQTFDRTRALAAKWDARAFRTGTRDCCAFVDTIASEAGLKVPEHQYLYPHDHIREMKLLNACHEVKSGDVGEADDNLEKTAQAAAVQKP